MQTALAGRGVELARDVGAGGGVVDEDAAAGRAEEGAVAPGQHRAQVVVVADAGADHLRIAHRLRGGGGGLAAEALDPGLRLGRGAVIDRDLVAFGGEVAGHMKTHHAQSEECDTHAAAPLLV
ncbi:hypothetical protein CBM2609_B110224 [Cupriavidus taiwanensis]|nr:hypothetical protein CBM2604_B120223 [Cupriavidus taiwanensis]SOZ30506.1 hypothetical protein CBM2609_B110224 [Cupriavidus taiwanensis]SOZ49777.1 hypothetical protein CBM2610_B90226 [Cupriavidus taiwanensis]